MVLDLQPKHRSIQRLPDLVSAPIQASARITCLGDVVLGLLRNAVDADATTIDIELDLFRGACRVSDNGSGISNDCSSISISTGADAAECDRVDPLGRNRSFVASLAAVSRGAHLVQTTRCAFLVQHGVSTRPGHRSLESVPSTACTFRSLSRHGGERFAPLRDHTGASEGDATMQPADGKTRSGPILAGTHCKLPAFNHQGHQSRLSRARERASRAFEAESFGAVIHPGLTSLSRHPEVSLQLPAFA